MQSIVTQPPARSRYRASGDDMNVASRLPDTSAAALADRADAIGQAAVPRLRSRPARAALRRNPERQSADRLVRGHQRKLHAARRPAAAHARPDLRTLSRGDARRIIVDRLDRAAQFRISAGLEGPRQTRRAEMGVGPSVLDRRTRQEPARSAADPLHQRSARSRRQPRPAGAGFPWPRHRARECLDLCPVQQFRNDGMGVPVGACRAAPAAGCCSTSTTSMSAPSTTATIR